MTEYMIFQDMPTGGNYMTGDGFRHLDTVEANNKKEAIKKLMRGEPATDQGEPDRENLYVVPASYWKSIMLTKRPTDEVREDDETFNADRGKWVIE